MTSHSEGFSYSCLFEGCQKKYFLIFLFSIKLFYYTRFKSEYNLNRHMRKHLQKEITPHQVYKCSYCDMEFSKKQQHRKHEFVSL